MRKFKSLAVAIAIVVARPAFADSNYTDESGIITETQVSQAISLLLRARVLEAKGSELTVKTPSILEQLNQQGRVIDRETESGGICVKGD